MAAASPLPPAPVPGLLPPPARGPPAELFDGGAAEFGAEEESFDDETHSAIEIADILRTDIMQLSCLQCKGATDQDSPCYATLHPFCDLFHRWISDRLGADRSQQRCQLPSQVLSCISGGRAAAAVARQLANEPAPSEAEIGRLCGDFDALSAADGQGEGGGGAGGEGEAEEEEGEDEAGGEEREGEEEGSEEEAGSEDDEEDERGDPDGEEMGEEGVADETGPTRPQR